MCLSRCIRNISLGVAGALCVCYPWPSRLLMEQARSADPSQRGNWRDFLVLVVLGLAVDLRWFEPAWPRGIRSVRQDAAARCGDLWVSRRAATGWVGFDLRLKWRDAAIGLREFWFLRANRNSSWALGMGFLHFHAHWPQPLQFCGAFLFTFLFIAIPEELFFRGGCRICWNGGSDGLLRCC